MPQIRRPFYNLHQITKGLYSSGNEFVLSDGSDYVGPYHILPTSQKFSEFQPENSSVELFEKRLNPTQDILRYNQITGNEINRYSVPISYYPSPSSEDYKRGKIERMFIQKRNSPSNTIMEIDGIQYNSINTQNNPGINGVIYNKLKVWWIISKFPKEDAAYMNNRVIIAASVDFPGITGFVSNPLEFFI